MFRSVGSKVAWVGRTASMVFGLALVMALVLGVASMALAGTGVGATFNLGKLNQVGQMSQLVGFTNGPMLRIDNNGGGADATALNLRVEPGQPPMTVGSSAKVPSLNADKLDGLDSSDLQGARAYAHINANGTLDASRSKNVNRSVKASTGVYCLNSTVPPRNVVATISAFSGSGMISQESGNNLCADSAGSYNILVHTLSSDGTFADKGFDVAIN